MCVCCCLRRANDRRHTSPPPPDRLPIVYPVPAAAASASAWISRALGLPNHPAVVFFSFSQLRQKRRDPAFPPMMMNVREAYYARRRRRRRRRGVGDLASSIPSSVAWEKLCRPRRSQRRSRGRSRSAAAADGGPPRRRFRTQDPRRNVPGYTKREYPGGGEEEYEKEEDSRPRRIERRGRGRRPCSSRHLRRP